jgi:FKBP-type peptidyl-prolyl cis-trans isomerase FkpA
MIHRRMIAAACGAFFGIILSGCNDLEQNQRNPSPVEMAPPLAQVERKPKPAELPDLPPGAGEIDPDVPTELTGTSSGLYYRILRKSDGKKPKATNSVVAKYHGWLDSGKVFDSTYEKNGGKPIEFPLNGVVKGWTEGLQLIGKGGMIELEIPSELGYGSRNERGIPPGATLHFVVELVDIK